MKTFKIREIQLGILMAILTFILVCISNVDVIMHFEYVLITIVSCILLLAGLLNLFIILNIPHEGYLKILYRNDDYFFNVHRIIFFSIFFVIFTIIVSLLAQAYNNSRGENILLLSCFVASFYFIIISIWHSYRFVYQSSMQENMDFDGIEDIKG